jgi:hypothetical protein
MHVLVVKHLQRIANLEHCVSNGQHLLQDLCNSCTAESNQGSGQQVSISPAAAPASEALSEHYFGGLDKHFYAESACYTTCQTTVEGCLDLYINRMLLIYNSRQPSNVVRRVVYTPRAIRVWAVVVLSATGQQS